MATPSGGANPPAKPWERAGSPSGAGPFKPPSPGSTSETVEASGTSNPGEIVSSANTATVNTLGRPVPARPWEQQQQQQQSYGGGYGSSLNYGSGTYGAGTYGSGTYGTAGTYGGLGGGYGGSYGGGGLYGNNMYRGGYSGLYGGAGTSMYGGGMYNSSMGGTMGGYGGMGMGMGGPYGEQDPNNPYGAPSAPPNFWISLMRVMQGVVTFFGRIAILIDQNTQAFHMFMTALLQLFDRSGVLYGELARFALRLLGVRTKPNKLQPPGPHMLQGPQNGHENNMIGPKAPTSGGWDNVWGENAGNQ